MDENEKKHTWVGRIIVILFAISLATFLIFLGVQLYRSTIYDMFNEVYITENLKEALDNNSDIRTHSVGTEGLGEDGIIKITELVYVKELGEDGLRVLLENALGIEIDGYLSLDLDAFGKGVDAQKKVVIPRNDAEGRAVFLPDVCSL